MGLDMYLYKKNYVKDWEFQEDVNYHTAVTINGEPRKDIKSKRVSYVIEEVAYWRKFNALHGYIVEKHADGIDECQEIELSLMDLEVILEIMTRIVNENFNKDVVETILPPTDGFFFGSQNIGEEYREDVEDTIKILSELIEEEKEASEEFGYRSPDYYYKASW
jgi:hypothetical protein